MFAYLCVALGGALGSMSRFWLYGLVGSGAATGFPWATLIINVTGSFVIGIFAALYEQGPMSGSPSFKQFFMVGICGGYTTFSSFSLDILHELKTGQILYAGGNVVLSVVLCLIAVWLGFLLGSLLNAVK